MNYFYPQIPPVTEQYFGQSDEVSRQQFGQGYGQGYGQPYGGYYPPRPPRCRWVRECRWVRRCRPDHGYGYGDSPYGYNDY